MLARAGVRKFTLVDDDVMFSANLVRNELSAAAAGVHKVDAIRSRLIEITGTIDVTVRRVALGGQESADLTDSVMSALRVCDVIIDATADAHCFNFCSAVAKESLKPFVWGEVFAGGIGGLVARVRSGHEPEPQAARNQINAWCIGGSTSQSGLCRAGITEANPSSAEFRLWDLALNRSRQKRASSPTRPAPYLVGRRYAPDRFL
jgi:hypothetical protein